MATNFMELMMQTPMVWQVINDQGKFYQWAMTDPVTGWFNI